MYFYLDSSLTQYNNNNEFAILKNAIRNLVLGYSAGNHLLGGDNDVLSYYKNVFADIDDYTYDVLSELWNKSYEGIPEGISFYIEVVRSVTVLFRVKNGVQIKQMRYDYFNDSNKIQKTKLIVEDLNDAFIYKYICECTLKYKEFEFEKINGGGKNIDKSIKLYVEEEKDIAITIRDSDKRFLEEEDSKSLIEFENNNNAFMHRTDTIYAYKILAVHEIENLIPIEIIDKLPYKNKNRQNQKSNFDKISKSNSANELLQFFDFKHGLSKLEDIYDVPDYKQYVKRVVSLNPDILLSYNNDFDSFYDSIDITKGNKGNIFPGLGEDILKLSVEYIKNNYNALIYSKLQLLDYQYKEWVRISNFIYTMCCCYKNNEARN